MFLCFLYHVGTDLNAKSQVIDLIFILGAFNGRDPETDQNIRDTLDEN